MRTPDCPQPRQTLTKYQVPNIIKRYIKRKEKELDRTCRMIWGFTNPDGDEYLFAHFCKNYDKLTVTIAYWDKRIHQYVPPRGI